MPSPLELIQRRFTRSAFAAPDLGLVALLRGGGRLSAVEALEVYSRGYAARMSEALGETFEACWRVLGDEDFLAACAEFARSVPSVSHNLSDYGAGFPALLKSRFASHAPFIADLGRLEWEFKELFHAAPHAGLAPAALAAARPGSRLRLGSAVRPLAFDYRVHALWRRDRADDTPLERRDWLGSERVVLYKSGTSAVFSRLLSGPEHAALQSLGAGKPLNEALESARGLDEAGAAGLFSFLAGEGLIAGIDSD